MLPQAERSPYSKQLFDAEERAKVAQKKLWEDYIEPEEEEEEVVEEEEEEKEEEESKKEEDKGEVTTTENGQVTAPAEVKSQQQKVTSISELESHSRALCYGHSAVMIVTGFTVSLPYRKH